MARISTTLIAFLALIILLAAVASGEHDAVARTAQSSIAASTAASAAGGMLSFAHRLGGRWRWIIAFGACIPLAIPATAIATALIQNPFAMDPYGPAVIIAAQAIAHLPIAFLIQAGALNSVPDDLLMASATLGVSPGATVRRVLCRPWLRSFWVSTALTALIIASDPSVTLVYGGTDSYLASHIFRSMSTGMTDDVGPNVAALVIPAILLAGLLSRRAGNWIDIQHKVRRRSPEFVSSQFVWRHRLLIAVVPQLIVVAAIVGTIVAGAVGASHVASGSLINTTLAVLIIAVPAALVCGLLTAVLAGRGGVVGFTVTAGLLATFLLSQTAIGMMLSALFRDSTSIWIVTFPSLVGGGSVAGGYVAVGIAYLTVAVPIAHVGFTVMLRSTRDLFDAARDAGADSVRAGVTLLPVLAPQIVAVTALVSGIILTRTAPITFVQPPGFDTASTSLTALAAAGWDDRVFAMSLMTASVAGGLLLLAVGSGVLFGRGMWSGSPRTRETTGVA
ncbi:hypothetical protein [Flaviflexus huanghaiensis]|uniref:hypothetical protein n=1 Tax=Flaviflexus huanghaiensis TaxID=1111473 RepID=UPI0015FCF3FD|nr:hypothetical protein [Flaviflexus huanghaiensis]